MVDVSNPRYWAWPGVTLIALFLLMTDCRSRGNRTGLENIRTQLDQIAERGAASDPVSGPDASRDWVAPYNRALSLKKEGRLLDATYYFSNALGADPGNIQVINDYVDTMLEVVSSSDSQDGMKSDQLRAVEAFLDSQVPHIEAEDVGTILELSRRVAAVCGPSVSLPAEVDSELQRQYQQLIQGTLELNDDLPDTADKVTKQLEELTVLRDFVAQQHDQTVEKSLVQLDSRIEILEVIEQYYLLATTVQQQLERTTSALNGQSFTAAAYCLQVAEPTLRALAALRSSLPDPCRKEIDHLLAEAERISHTVADGSNRGRSKAAWEAYLKEHDKSYQQALAFKEDEALKEAPKSCQARLEQIAQVNEQLQRVLPNLFDEEYRKQASERMERIAETTQAIALTQHRRYNEWALSEINTAFTQAHKAEGWVNDNEEGIAKALIDHMGSIDSGLLTREASRCYQEVFEKYFSELGGVSAPDDFDSPGRKLNVLQEMLSKEKRTLSQF